jgi:hypothetical protein
VLISETFVALVRFVVALCSFVDLATWNPHDGKFAVAAEDFKHSKIGVRE